MLLTLITTHRPATDIGYLLGKNPNLCQSFPVAFGQVHVFYPILKLPHHFSRRRDDRRGEIQLLQLDAQALEVDSAKVLVA